MNTGLLKSIGESLDSHIRSLDSEIFNLEVEQRYYKLLGDTGSVSREISIESELRKLRSLKKSLEGSYTENLLARHNGVEIV